MITGHVVLENFDYAIGDAELPLFKDGEPLLDEEGEPAVAHYNILAITPSQGLAFEIRLQDEPWETLVQNLTKTRVKTATLQEIEQLAKILP